MSETRDARQDYFEYLENVLGIKTILQSVDLFSEEVTATELLFCVQDYENYSEEEKDLLQKMISAVKVDASRLKVCDSKNIKRYETECLVIFEDIPQQNTNLSAKFAIHTFSPRVLLKKPELKKQAWTDLQKILPYFT